VRTTPLARRGRGAASNRVGRFERWQREEADDGWGGAEGEPRPVETELAVDDTRSIIATNDSPDVPFDRSINPYRGCEHGCVYCFARPSHAYLGYSPGLDFETRLLYKPRAAGLLEAELARPGYRCAPIVLGANTDAYQPAERRLGITRGVLEVLRDYQHPVSVVTKSSLVERDLDLLGEMARAGLAEVRVSVTTLDAALARRMEPRAAAPHRRLETIRRVQAAGVPVGVLFAPVIPGLNDPEMETVLAAAREAGAGTAGYVLLRLPLELAPLFREWIDIHYPEKAARVLALVRETRGGRDYDPRFGARMRGTGPYAEVLARRFELATRRLGYGEGADLDASRFQPPGARQIPLF
jgi:DNA repair photolyase